MQMCAYECLEHQRAEMALERRLRLVPEVFCSGASFSKTETRSRTSHLGELEKARFLCSSRSLRTYKHRK